MTVTVIQLWLNLTHGMELYPDINQGARNNENGVYFYGLYALIKKHTVGLTESDISVTKQIIENLQTYDQDGKQIQGLYDRGMEESLASSQYFKAPSERRTISHDNLTAISRLSTLLDLPYAKHIADYALKNQMRFDNCYPEKPRWNRIQHPRDYFFWLWNGGYKLLSIPFYPIFFISNILTTLTPNEETSGKLLMFTRLFSQKPLLFKMNWWICNWIMKKRYKTENWMVPVTAIYFHQREDNPIRVLAKDLKL